MRLSREREQEIREAFTNDRLDSCSPSRIWAESGLGLRWTAEEYLEANARDFLSDLLPEIDGLRNDLDTVRAHSDFNYQRNKELIAERDSFKSELKLEQDRFLKVYDELQRLRTKARNLLEVCDE